MIKLGLKNYLKSYRLFFLPIGALSLGIVIGLSCLSMNAEAYIKDMADATGKKEEPTVSLPVTATSESAEKSEQIGSN